jgi:hypothetical protein
VIEFLLSVAAIFLAGFLIAENHHRIREFAVGVGIGNAVESAIPPDLDDDTIDNTSHPRVHSSGVGTSTDSSTSSDGGISD